MSQQPRKGYKIVSLVTGNLVLDMELLAKLIQYKWRIRIEMFKIGFVYVVRNLSLALRLSVCPVVGKSLTCLGNLQRLETTCSMHLCTVRVNS